jgi:hypothetical protein
VRNADFIIAEVNRTVPMGLAGMHDIFEVGRPPAAKIIPVTHPMDRVGTPYIPCPPEKIAAVVYSDLTDEPQKFKPITPETEQIGEHVVAFLKAEIAAGRLPEDPGPIQSGVGSIGNAVLVTVSLAISVATFIYIRRKLRSSPMEDATKSNAALGFEQEEDDKVRSGEDKCQKSGALVCFEGGEELRLETLLKASAEVLGKGVSGSTYKAVLEDGIVAAVKRLSALQFPGRSKAFDRHMRLVGRLRHRHVVSLRGYCSSNGERLLVYDYLPNGSLQSLLQINGTCA